MKEKNAKVATIKNNVTTQDTKNTTLGRPKYMPSEEELQAREEKREERRKKQEEAHQREIDKVTAEKQKKAENLNNVVNNVKKETNTPTGEVKATKDKEAIKKAREEQYKNFRIGALKRRAKRMGLSEEDTKKKIEELLVQLDTPNSYSVLILFSPKDESLVVQALKNEDLAWKMKSNSHLFIDADQETLATLRSIMPPTAKIHPYVKKKPSVLPVPEPPKAKAKPKTKAEKRALAVAAKLARKKQMHASRGEHAKVKKAERCKKMRAIAKAKKLFEKRCQKALKKKTGTVVQLKAEKSSKSSKKASMNLKQAA